MLDALLPAVESFLAAKGEDASGDGSKALNWLEAATIAAENGAKETTSMKV